MQILIINTNHVYKVNKKNKSLIQVHLLGRC